MASKTIFPGKMKKSFCTVYEIKSSVDKFKDISLNPYFENGAISPYQISLQMSLALGDFLGYISKSIGLYFCLLLSFLLPSLNSLIIAVAFCFNGICFSN